MSLRKGYHSCCLNFSRIIMSQRLLVKAKSLILCIFRGHREVQGRTFENSPEREGENDPLRCWMSSERRLSGRKQQPARNLKPWLSWVPDAVWEMNCSHCLLSVGSWCQRFPEAGINLLRSDRFQGEVLILLSALFLFHKPPTPELCNFPIVQLGKNNMGKYKDFLNVDSEMEGPEEEIILRKSGFWSWICPCQAVWPRRFHSMSLNLNGLKETGSLAQVKQMSASF